MKVAKVIKACHSRVGDGSEFLWDCYPTALSLGLYDKNTKPLGSVTYNYQTGKVYELIVELDENTGFRWINPKFLSAYNIECELKNVNPTEAWDNVTWIDVDKSAIMALLVSRYYNETIDVSKYQPTESVETDTTSDVPSSVVYNTKIVVKHEFEVKSQSMVDAIHQAKRFVSIMKPPVASPDNVTWNDSIITSEIVERRYEFPESESSTESQHTIQYTVYLLVSHDVDVIDDDMANAIVLAKNFVDTIRPGSSWPTGLVWIDSYVTSETVERKNTNV